MTSAMTAVLAPLGRLYSLGIAARSKLYERGLLATNRIAAPVVSVGNITLGGTGKTPLVAWIANRLIASGYRVCVLTRGYHRVEPNSRMIVSDGEKILSDAQHAGDEAFLLAEMLHGRAAIISDPNRVEAARWALEALTSQVLVLDDGFQHLRIARDLNIVTIDATNPFGNGRVIPAGILREPLSGLRRADCFLMTRVDEATKVEELKSKLNQLNPDASVFTSRINRIRFRRHGESSSELAESGPVAAFCAIGNPHSFFFLLRREGFDLSYTKVFRDHFSYDESTLDSIAREAKHHGAQAILTTAKDEVKLRTLSCPLPLYAVDIDIEIEEEPAFLDLINQAIE